MRIPVTPGLRKRILSRDGHKCTRCESVEKLRIHHKVLVSKGGTNHPDNLVTLCHDCHIAVHTERGDWFAGLMAGEPSKVPYPKTIAWKGHLFWKDKPFIRQFRDTPYPPEMSHSDIGRIALLSKRLHPGTNMIGYVGNGGVRPYTTEQIAEFIQLGPRLAVRFMNHMKDLGMVGKVELVIAGSRQVQWYINPLYYTGSAHISRNLYVIFRKQLDAVLPAAVIEWFNAA